MSSEDVADWGRRQEIHQVRISVLSIGISYREHRDGDKGVSVVPKVGLASSAT